MFTYLIFTNRKRKLTQILEPKVRDINGLDLIDKLLCLDPKKVSNYTYIYYEFYIKLNTCYYNLMQTYKMS